MFACQQDRKGVKNLAKQQPVKQSSNMHIGVESSREEIYRAVVVCCSRGLLAAAVLMLRAHVIALLTYIADVRSTA